MTVVVHETDAIFTGDVLAHLGLDNVFDGHDGRYPRVELTEVRAADLVLLPDEPYAFTPDDGPEAFPGVPTVLLPGRLLTWYGPSLATARGELLGRIGSAPPLGSPGVRT